MALKLKLNFILLIISLLILGALILYGNPSGVLAGLLKFDLSTILLLILLAVAGLILRFIRFKLLLDRKYETKASSLFPVFVFGLSLANSTPGRAAEPVRAVLVKRSFGIPTGYTLASIFFERLSDMLVIFALSIFAFLAVKAEPFIVPFLLVVLAVLAVVIATQSKRLYFMLGEVMRKTLLWLSNFILKKKIRNLALKLNGLLKYTYTELRISKMLAVQIIFSLLIWGGAYSALLYLSLNRLGIPIDYFSSSGIFALSLVIGLASFLPGGLGSTEAAMTILLSMTGVEYSVALTAAIVMRALSLWDVVILGPICALYIKEKKNLRAKFRSGSKY